jgi:hypothetical protein
MSFLDAVKAGRKSPFIPTLNTGLLFDLAVGSYVPSVDGNWILNGGLGTTNATIGRPQRFKSTDLLCKTACALSRYPGSMAIVYDTERTLSEDRIVRMSDIPGLDVDRIMLTTRSEYYGEEFYDFLRHLSDEKIKDKKNTIVETPFVDPRAGKAARIWIPTIVVVDSLSNLEFKIVADMIDAKMSVDGEGVARAKYSITDSQTNTAHMKDGNGKKRLVAKLNALAEKTGFYFLFSAHVGSKIELDPYAKPMKAFQHMRQADKIKGVGTDFEFLMMTLLNCDNSVALMSDNDRTKSLYPTKDGHTSAVELNEVMQTVVRCKGNVSGTRLKSVISQTEGPLPALSSYHYLKTSKYAGLPGNPTRHAPALLPDETLMRTTVNDILREKPHVARAIQLLAELHFIQENWSLRHLPPVFSTPLEDFAEKLTKSSYAMDDILATRGWWTYNYGGEKPEQPFMSTLDALMIASGEYKPKFLQAKTA